MHYRHLSLRVAQIGGQRTRQCLVDEVSDPKLMSAQYPVQECFVLLLSFYYHSRRLGSAIKYHTVEGFCSGPQQASHLFFQDTPFHRHPAYRQHFVPTEQAWSSLGCSGVPSHTSRPAMPSLSETSGNLGVFPKPAGASLLCMDNAVLDV